MYAGPERESNVLAQRLLDPGRDDYYGHSSSWWDVQDSLWLEQVGTSQVALQMAVFGGGRVTSSPAGVDCRADCELLFNAQARVTLTARPDAGLRLRGWSGACTGAAPACTVTLASAQQVGARFGPPNQPPAAGFELTATHPIARALTVTSSSHDRDGTIVAHAWDFGDGHRATGATATHTYASPGTFRVRLTVTDDEGASASAERTVRVVDNPPAATPYPRTARAGASVRLAFRVEDDVRVERARLFVLSGARVVASFTRAIGAQTATGHVTWRAPGVRGSYRSCVKAWDSRGQSSGRRCASVRVR
ncbi:MAG: PKD domain-containing protein [Thermoleophilia bacterium]|nr:PKD domain-containing protein [Thermoleophilia bacterium]